MTVQERIRSRRSELGMSQDELARRVGYKGKTAISKIENGECQIRQTMLEKSKRQIIRQMLKEKPLRFRQRLLG